MELFNETTILGFQNLLQGFVPTPGYLGVHTGGHFTVGGDPGGVRSIISLFYIRS